VAALPARQPTGATIRVGLVEDHHLVREGLKLMLGLAKGIQVVGEAYDAATAFDMLARDRPDVMIVDLTLGDTDGIPVVRALAARRPGIRIVVLSMHRDAETVRQALLAGALAYVVKGAHGSDLLEAVRAVTRGERYLHSSVTSAIVDDSIRWLQSGSPLSAREREILGLVAAGKSHTTIGRMLGISPHTVRRHVANLSAKLQVRGTPALVRYAIQHGILREDT
jgi:DNA-binding NarL/FixJ family response regulator